MHKKFYEYIYLIFLTKCLNHIHSTLIATEKSLCYLSANEIKVFASHWLLVSSCEMLVTSHQLLVTNH